MAPNLGLTMITDADRATHQALTLKPEDPAESAIAREIAPTAGLLSFLSPATQPTAPTKRPTLSLSHAAHSARAKAKAQV